MTVSPHSSSAQQPHRYLQYGPPKAAGEVLQRIADCAESIQTNGTSDDPGVAVEVITTHPYTSTLGVVTAVGSKFGDVLLTIEPQNQWTHVERVDLVEKALRAGGLNAANTRGLAAFLVDAGVLPTRDF